MTIFDIRQLTKLLLPFQYPYRAIVCCDDSTVRIVSPVNGRVITTALLPLGVMVEDLLVLPAKNRLLLCCSDDVVRVLDTNTNPCELVSQWTKGELGE